MSLPPAFAPVAVLVLAWDETVPAVRALVEPSELTGPPLDSVVVLVPAGPATAALTQEEFLPLADDDLLAATLLDTAPAASTPAPIPEATPPAAEAAPTNVLPVSESVTAIAPTATTAAAFSLPNARPQGPLPVADTVATPTILSAEASVEPLPRWPTVRVLRLSDYSLAELATQARQALPASAWTGVGSLPAAPYLGSSLATPQSSTLLPPPATVADFAWALAPVLASSGPALIPGTGLLPEAALSTRRYLPAEPAAPDAEADTAPDYAPDELLPAAEASITEQLEVAAEAPEAAFPAALAPVQAGWSEALASLQAPAAFVATEKPAAPTVDLDSVSFPLNESSPTPAASEVEAAAPAPSPLVPAANSFDAPNLNFQIIQYARFAVPLALANEPFAVIYAPAWPTWLAAQELRQRTGRPLVLHVASLAAEDEPLELAAGWPAEIQRQALHRADLILTETPALAYRLRQELSLPAHRVRPVPAADAAAVAQALGTVQVH